MSPTDKITISTFHLDRLKMLSNRMKGEYPSSARSYTKELDAILNAIWEERKN